MSFAFLSSRYILKLKIEKKKKRKEILIAKIRQLTTDQSACRISESFSAVDNFYFSYRFSTEGRIIGALYSKL